MSRSIVRKVSLRRNARTLTVAAFSVLVRRAAGQTMLQPGQIFRLFAGSPAHRGETLRQPYRVLAGAGAELQQIAGAQVVGQHFGDRPLVAFGGLGKGCGH